MPRSWSECRFDWLDQLLLEDGKSINDCACRVATFLWRRSDKDTGEVWWSKEKIAELLGKDERTIRNALNAIQAAGYIEKKCGRHHGVKSIWQLRMPKQDGQSVLQFDGSERKNCSNDAPQNWKDLSEKTERSFRPYKKEPRKRIKAQAREDHRSDPRQDQNLRPVEPNSHDQERWRQWLRLNGFGELEGFKLAHANGRLLLPMGSPPSDEDSVGISKCTRWFRDLSDHLGQPQRISA